MKFTLVGYVEYDLSYGLCFISQDGAKHEELTQFKPYGLISMGLECITRNQFLSMVVDQPSEEKN
jgi:hypothetical protein